MSEADAREVAKLQLPDAKFSTDGGRTWVPLVELVQPSKGPRVEALPDDADVRTRSEPPAAPVAAPAPAFVAAPPPGAGPVRAGQLKRCALFADMTEEETAVFIDLLEKFQVRPFQVMAARGSHGDSIYIILAGEARVSVTEAGAEKFLNYLRAGDFFGEMALVDAQPRSADVVASSECVVLRLTRERFEAVLGEQPRLAGLFLLGLNRVLAKRLRDTNAQLLKAQTFNRAAQQLGG